MELIRPVVERVVENTTEPGIKCELIYWQREKKLKEEIEAARRETGAAKQRNKKLIALLMIAVLFVLFVGGAAVRASRENTAATATVGVLTEYEKQFKATDDLLERIEIAKEVNKLFGKVESMDLPEKNADFVEACRTITERLGGNGNEQSSK